MKRILLVLALLTLFVPAPTLRVYAQEESDGACDITAEEHQNFIDAGILWFDCEVPPEPTTPPPGASGPSGPLVGCNSAQQIWNYFTQTRGLAPGIAAGFLGNMMEEAHFEPRLVEYGWPNSRGETSVAGQPSSLDDAIPPNRNAKGQPGYGIIQWTSPGRKAGLQAISDRDPANRGVNDLSLQLDFVWEELNGGYKGSTLDPLLALGPNADPRQASAIITRNYEIPGRMSETLPRRQNHAFDFFTQFTTGQGCNQ